MKQKFICSKKFIDTASEFDDNIIRNSYMQKTYMEVI